MLRLNRTALVQLTREMALVGACYLAYSIGRGLIYSHLIAEAFDNAWKLAYLEKAIGLLMEPALQKWFVEKAPQAVLFFNWFYIFGYLPFIALVAIGLYLNNREAYERYRTVALITFSIALLLYELYPLAPPRMMQSIGFVDTIEVLGPFQYSTTSESLLYNPYAAMPSMHFGLAFLISLVFLRSQRRLSKALGCVYILAMLVSIVVTGNHYWIDALAAVAVVGASFGIYRLMSWQPVRRIIMLPVLGEV